MFKLLKINRGPLASPIMSLPIWFWKAEAGGVGRTYQFWISQVDLGSNALPTTRAVWHGAKYLTFLCQFPDLLNQVLTPTPNWAGLVSEICTKGLTLSVTRLLSSLHYRKVMRSPTVQSKTHGISLGVVGSLMIRHFSQTSGLLPHTWELSRVSLPPAYPE